MKPPTQPGQSSEVPYPERMKLSSEALYALLTSPFERPFDSLGYSARIALRVSRDSAVFERKNQESFHSLTGKLIDKERGWNVELGHVPEQDSLGIVRVEIPTKTSAHNQQIIFQRCADNYFLILEQNGDDDPQLNISPIDKLESSFNASEETDAIQCDAIVVQRILFAAGYSLPDAAPTPDALRLHMAETLQDSTKWGIQETVTTITGEHMQITTTRLVSSRTESAGNELGKGRTGRRRDARRSRQIDAHIETVIEDISLDGATRNQLIITFEGEDYTIKDPTVTARVLQLDTSDETVANYGNGQYIAMKNDKVPVTPELLDTLTANIVTDIIGD